MKNLLKYAAISLPFVLVLYFVYKGYMKSREETKTQVGSQDTPRESTTSGTSQSSYNGPTQGEVNPDLIPTFIPGKQ